MSDNNTPHEIPPWDEFPDEDNAISDLEFSTVDRSEEAFGMLRAAFAMRGQTLNRIEPPDQPVTILVERWGFVKHLPTIGDAILFLEQIGGRK